MSLREADAQMYADRKRQKAGIVITVLRKHTFGFTLPSLKTDPKAAVMNTDQLKKREG